MEGGSARQFVPFNDDNILPSHLGEMMGNACPANSTSDDDCLCVCGKFHMLSPLICMFGGRVPRSGVSRPLCLISNFGYSGDLWFRYAPQIHEGLLNHRIIFYMARSHF